MFTPIVHTAETHLPRFYTRATLSSRGAMPPLPTESPAKVDVERVRKDMLDLATASVVHLNNAGDSPMPRPVLERVTSHMQAEAMLGGYEAAARCDEELEAVYESAAQLINAEKDEIAMQVCGMSPRVYATCCPLLPRSNIRSWYESLGAVYKY